MTARELSLAEIKEIREHIPEEMEIETFIHGAMCISYSGRCLLSNYFTGRDANQRLHPSVPVEVCGRGRVQTGGVSAGV